MEQSSTRRSSRLDLRVPPKTICASQNGRAIVIPFRVQGFGPYAEVLKGLDYASDGRGLVPDTGVTEWIEHQIAMLERAEFRGADSSTGARGAPRRGHGPPHDEPAAAAVVRRRE